MEFRTHLRRCLRQASLRPSGWPGSRLLKVRLDCRRGASTIVLLGCAPEKRSEPSLPISGRVAPEPGTRVPLHHDSRTDAPCRARLPAATVGAVQGCPASSETVIVVARVVSRPMAERTAGAFTHASTIPVFNLTRRRQMPDLISSQPIPKPCVSSRQDRHQTRKAAHSLLHAGLL